MRNYTNFGERHGLTIGQVAHLVRLCNQYAAAEAHALNGDKAYDGSNWVRDKAAAAEVWSAKRDAVGVQIAELWTGTIGQPNGVYPSLIGSDGQPAWLPTLETTLTHYRFDLDKPEDAAAWDALKADRKAAGITPSESLKPYNYCKNFAEYQDSICELAAADGGSSAVIPLEPDHVFDNQWNGEDLRLMDWTDWVYENRKIREGYYLDITPELQAVRDETVKCGYTGRQLPAKDAPAFNVEAFDSPHLKESDLRLCRFAPVSASDKKRFKPLTDAERAKLLPIYTHRQTVATDSRNVKQLASQRAEIIADCDKTTADATTKRDGLLWLMDRQICIDNVIFYNHTGNFCFGWRTPVSGDVREALESKLAGFPFPVEFETA